MKFPVEGGFLNDYFKKIMQKSTLISWHRQKV